MPDPPREEAAEDALEETAGGSGCDKSLALSLGDFSAGLVGLSKPFTCDSPWELVLDSRPWLR